MDIRSANIFGQPDIAGRCLVLGTKKRRKTIYSGESPHVVEKWEGKRIILRPLMNSKAKYEGLHGV